MIPAHEIEIAIRRLDERTQGGRSLFEDASVESEITAVAAELMKRFGSNDVPIHSIYAEDPAYPSALRGLPAKDRPEGFVAAGNLALLDGFLVGICGSRKASERGLKVAEDACRELALRGVTVVSGYAAGVDETAHLAALTVGGATICVLAEGLSHFRIKKTLANKWDWSRVLVLSQFGLRSIWQASRAMQRNKTIVGLSRATIVVEARDRGGTLDAGLTALRLKKPLFVADFSESGTESAGNTLLLREGATPFRRSRTTGGPSFLALNRLMAQG